MIVHGGRIYEIAALYEKKVEDFIDFSVNINPYIDRQLVEQSIIDSIGDIQYYPEDTYSDIRNLISKSYDLSSSYIYIGNGAGDIIYKTVHAFHKPMHAFVLSPTFSEYEKAILSVYGSKIEYYDLGDSLELSEDYLTTLKSKKEIDIIYLCNPNNPTGSLIDVQLLEDILEYCNYNNIWVIIDECFMDFVKNNHRYSAIYFINKYYNLMIIKSFTKIFSIPALRLGFLISKNIEFLDAVKEITPSWNVNTFAVNIAKKFIECDIKDTILKIHEQRQILINELKQLGISVYNSKANYILFRLDMDIDLFDELVKRNIIIRDCSNYRGLKKGYYRIAVRNERDNILLIKELKDILNNTGKLEKYEINYDTGDDVKLG